MNRVVGIFTVASLVLFQGRLFCVEGEKAEEKPESAAEVAEHPLPPGEYLVSAQDLLAITVVNELDLTGIFEVSKEGTIKYPYLAYLPVAGKTVKQIEEQITSLLKPDWLVSPQVNVRVHTYSEKLVYVQGQVNRPGNYSFSGKNVMTLYRAISMAGGFNRIANVRNVVLMTTNGKGQPVSLEYNVAKIIEKPELDPFIKASDSIWVKERIF